MHRATLARRRIASQAALLGAMLALVVIVGGLLIGIPRYLSLAETISARSSLAAADPIDAAVQAQIRLAADAPAQTAAMDAVLAPLLVDTAAHVYRTVQSPPLDVDGTTLVIGADPEVGSRTTLVSGSAGAVLQDDAASALGLAAGDTVTIGSTAIEITGTWLPLDASDPYWFADPAVQTGESSGAYGPLLVDEQVLASLDVNPFVRWTLVPDVASITTAQLAPLYAAANTWEAGIRADPALSAGGVVFAGGLAATVATIDRSIASVQGVSPIPLVLSGVIGLIALLQLARLLAEVRTDETLLLRARGRPASRAAFDGAVEGALVVVPGIAIGTVIAVLVVPAGTTSWFAPVAAAAVGVALLAFVAGAAARRSHLPGRASTSAVVASLVLVVIAAAVSLWQFRLYGSPLVTTAGGESVVDPVAVLAPSLGLLACGVIAVAVLSPLASGVASLAARSRDIIPVLPARQVARQAAMFGTALLLVCLAVGGTTLASGYAATWSSLSERAGELRNGSDVRVAIATSSTVGGATSIVSSPPVTIEGTTTTPVLVADTQIADDPVSLVALSGDEIGAVMADLGASFDPGRVDDLVSSPAQGLPLDGLAITAATTVTTAIAGAPTTPDQGATELVAWVADAQGALARVPLVSGSADLPVGVAPWTLLALDTAVTIGPNAATYDVTFDTDLSGWVPQEDAGTEFDGSVQAADNGFTLTALAPGPAVTVRLMPEAGDPLPVAVTDALAARIGLGTGDTVQLRVAGTGLIVEGRLAGTVALLPGSSGSLGAITDLRALNEHVLRETSSVPRPDQFWIGTDDVEATVAALRPELPASARLTTIESGAGNALQRPVVLALWLGGAGALVMAAAALAAAAGALARSRRAEVVTLRALGLGTRALAASRRAELLLVLALAVALGVASGILVSMLTVGELARSAVLDAPAALASTVQFDVVTLAVLLAGFTALALVIVAVNVARVRRQATRSTGRELSS